MSITLEHPTANAAAVSSAVSSSTVISWAKADAGLWVGNAGGTFGGSIDRVARNRYRATDPFGGARGEFATFDEARDCLECFMSHPAVAGRLGARRG